MQPMDTWLHLDLAIRVEIGQDEGGAFVVAVPCLPGVVARGETIAAALENAREAIQCHVAGSR